MASLESGCSITNELLARTQPAHRKALPVFTFGWRLGNEGVMEGRDRALIESPTPQPFRVLPWGRRTTGWVCAGFSTFKWTAARVPFSHAQSIFAKVLEKLGQRGYDSSRGGGRNFFSPFQAGRLPNGRRSMAGARPGHAAAVSLLSARLSIF